MNKCVFCVSLSHKCDTQHHIHTNHTVSSHRAMICSLMCKKETQTKFLISLQFRCFGSRERKTRKIEHYDDKVTPCANKRHQIGERVEKKNRNMIKMSITFFAKRRNCANQAFFIFKKRILLPNFIYFMRCTSFNAKYARKELFRTFIKQEKRKIFV